jgi:hypothetical protein
MLVGSNNGGVDHHVFVVAITGQLQFSPTFYESQTASAA